MSTRTLVFFFFTSRRRHTRCSRDWSSDVCSSDLDDHARTPPPPIAPGIAGLVVWNYSLGRGGAVLPAASAGDRKSTRLNSSHGYISYAVFCLKKKNNTSS